MIAIQLEVPTPAPTRDHKYDVAHLEIPQLPQMGSYFEFNGFEFLVQGVMLTPQREYDAVVVLRQ